MNNPPWGISHIVQKVNVVSDDEFLSLYETKGVETVRKVLNNFKNYVKSWNVKSALRCLFRTKVHLSALCFIKFKKLKTINQLPPLDLAVFLYSTSYDIHTTWHGLDCRLLLFISPPLSLHESSSGDKFIINFFLACHGALTRSRRLLHN